MTYGSLTCISPEFAGDVSTCEKGTPLTAFFDKKIVFDVPPAALPLTSILAAALPNGNRDIEILKFSSGSHSPQRLRKVLRRRRARASLPLISSLRPLRLCGNFLAFQLKTEN